MYTAYSGSEQQELNGLFKSIGKILKAPLKIAGKLAPAVVAGMTGIPLPMIMSAKSPNQPYTGGGGGVAVTQADLINRQVAQLQARNQANALAAQSRAPVPYPAVAAGGTGLPKWALPVGGAVLVGGLALILLTRK